MKRLNAKRACATLGSSLSMLLINMNAIAAEAEGSASVGDQIASPIVSFINSLMAPLLAIVGAVGTLYCVLLGVKFAKAEEPQDREKAKDHLKNAVIGFILIFILILALNILMKVMPGWVAENAQ